MFGDLGDDEVQSAREPQEPREDGHTASGDLVEAGQPLVDRGHADQVAGVVQKEGPDPGTDGRSTVRTLLQLLDQGLDQRQGQLRSQELDRVVDDLAVVHHQALLQEVVI